MTLIFLLASNSFKAALEFESFFRSIHFPKQKDVILKGLCHVEMILVQALLEYLKRTDIQRFSVGIFALIPIKGIRICFFALHEFPSP